MTSPPELKTHSTNLDSQLYRRTLAEFASGVTVVTGGRKDAPLGFVCQSFSSVSLSPPLVMFCVDHSSRTWPGLREAGRFCVNILADDQHDICQRFGSKNGRKFEALEWDWSRWDTPVIRGTLARIHCEISAVHTEGDHDIVIGTVLGLEPDNHRKRPLVFFRGGFDIASPAPGTMPAGG